MCWTSSKTPVRCVAKENIVVYKYVKLITKREFPCFWRKKLIAAISDIYNYKYCPYIENQHTNIRINKRGWKFPTWEINEGYHSVESPNIYITSSFLPNVKFIIPKGAFYYINEKGEIVSSSIIMTDELVNKKKHW